MLAVRSSQWLVACLVISLGDFGERARREVIAVALLESWLRTVDRLLCAGADDDRTPRRPLSVGEVDVAVGELVERCTGVAGAIPEGPAWAAGFRAQASAVATIIKRLMGPAT